MNKRVIIDTDPGVDDALALLLALKSPELRVELITTVAGNVSFPLTTKNLFRILSLLPGPHPEVARGCASPLRLPLADSGGVHGADGLGNLDEKSYPFIENPPISSRPAPEAILWLVRNNPGEITIITLGPLTNLAVAILSDSVAMKGAKEIISMLGAYAVPGNASPVAEFNAYCDPDAAQIVLNSSIPLTLVGLDVTHQAVLSRQTIEESTARGGRLAQFVRDCTANYINFHERKNLFSGCYLHDPLAVAAAIDPSLALTRDLFVQVETEGAITRGMTVADLRPVPEGPPNAKVCFEVNAEAFLKLFLQRVLP